MVKRKFAKLKGLMLETGITQEEAARIMGRSKTYLSYRLNSRESFTFEDAAKLGGYLGIPKTEWVDYFTEG